MKSKILKILTASTALVMLASCTSQQAAEATAVHTIEKQVILNESLEIFETLPTCSAIDYTISEPDIKKGMGATQDIVFYRDGNPIYGKITHPKGKGPFKTIIISSGLYAPLGRYSNKARSYAEKGYAVIEFQFQNGEAPETYADPEYIGDFIFEQVSDLYAVMDSLEYISYVDMSNIYLYGHSMGGLVASYVGCFRQNKVKGLILVDPSFYATDLMEFEHEQTISTDIYTLLKACRIPALIITGTAGSFGEDPEFFDEARKSFPYCEYVVIDGATHSFEGAVSEEVVEVSVEVIESWNKSD